MVDGGNPSPHDAADIDTGLACLVLLLKFLQIPADPEQLKHLTGKGSGPLVAEDLVRLAKEMEVKAKIKKSSLKELAKLPLPAIAEDREGKYFILAQVKEEAVLIQSPLEKGPKTLTFEELDAVWNGRVVLLTSRATLAGNARKFDVTWFIPALVRYRELLGEVLLASFFLQLFALVTPLFFQVVIDKVLVHNGISTLEVMVFGLIVVSIFDVLVGSLRTYVFSHTTNRVDVELGAKLFNHLITLPMSYFASRPVGHSVARVRELENIRNFLTSSSITLVIDLFFTIIFFAVMLIYSPFLTLVVALSLPFYFGISLGITPALRARLDEKFQRGAENQAFLVESITGVETLKAMAVEPQMQRKWENLLAGYVTSSFKASMLGNFGSHGVQLVNKVTVGLTLFFGAKLVLTGDLTVGQLVAFNMLASRVSQPILRLAQMWQDFQQMRISVARLGDVLNTPPEPTHSPNRSSLPTIRGEIVFDNVTFRYRPDGPEVLRKVKLRVPPGEILGIVGPSGSGKSTLAKLVQRMYVPESGRVLVDGVDLNLIDPSWLRRQIGVVLQENILFHRSLKENIALADPTKSMDEVIRAAELAGAHEFILQLPEGYDTKIDERGANLSGGQRQRIAIARALITNPKILIFDEATSALDAESEDVIQKNMKEIARFRTVLIISHRLSAIRQAHRIITVEGGEITEVGTHQSLMEAGGRYSKLYNTQMNYV